MLVTYQFTLDVSIIKDANNKAVVSADGLVISQVVLELLSLLQPPQLVTQVQNTFTKYRWFNNKRRHDN